MIKLVKKIKFIHIVISFMILYAFIKSFRPGDIDFFVETGTRFLNHIDLYKVLYKEDIYFVYSPVFSFLISPFTFLPIFLVRLIWALANVYFVIEIFKILLSFLPENINNSKLNLITFLSIIFTIHFFNLNFIIGQMTICMLYICLKSVYENEKKNIVFAGFLLAIGMIIKIMPIIVMAYFFYNKNFKTIIWTIFFVFILFLAPYLAMPFEVINSYYLSWFDAMLNGGGGFTREYTISMHSLHSLSLAYFTNYSHVIEREIDLPFFRNFANISIESVKLISIGASLFLIFLTPIVLKRMPFTYPKSKLHFLYEIGYLCLITPLIFPMQQKYGYLFTLPSILYVLYICFDSKLTGLKKILTYIIVIVFFILVSLSTVNILVGNTITIVSEYYKLLVWGTLLFIIPYMINHPNTIENKTVLS